MVSTGHKDCYGKMFPDASDHRTDQHVSGKAFWLERETAGGMSFGPRHVGVDAEGWDECRSCSDFDDCYKLGVGLVVLGTAIGVK